MAHFSKRLLGVPVVKYISQDFMLIPKMEFWAAVKLVIPS